MQPRKREDIERIIKEAGYPSAAADLEEFDSLLAEEASVDPSIELSPDQKERKAARERRLKFLGQKLFKKAGKKTRRSH
jgi:hypothetical protein